MKPSYAYEYGVADEYTGDMKAVYENRDGHFVQGGYQFLQPDGILRVVTYTSDPWHGFQTNIQMLNGHAVHPIPTPTHYHQPIAAGSNYPFYQQPFPVSSNQENPAPAQIPAPVLSRKPIVKAKNKKYKTILRFTTTRPQYVLSQRQFPVSVKCRKMQEMQESAVKCRKMQ